MKLMSITGFVFFIILLLLQAVVGQFGSGGSDTFNYDASSACSKPYSRNGREHHEKLPCDFRRQNWCIIAGSTYPWHAVRRFVYENQGLMRRMYGDEKHINILKDELGKNDIELDYEDDHDRYFDQLHRSMHDDQYDFERYEEEEEEKMDKYRGRTAFTSESSKQRPFTRFNFRSMEETTITSRTTSQTAPAPAAAAAAAASFSSSSSSSSSFPINDDPGSTTIKPWKKLPSNLNETQDKFNDKISIIPGVKLSEIARVKNSSVNEIPGILNTMKANVSDNAVMTEWPSNTETVLVDEIFKTNATARQPTIDSTIDDRMDKVPVVEDNKEELSFDESEQQQQQKQQFRPRPEYRPSETQSDSSSVKEGQLFQDFDVKDDEQQQPVIKLRGVNACPVKDEVVAPFWANNTKGEILALLNLYPFQQFVHWEKCTFENKQMYCREGCKCEQQYRLYRLLAYDPNNECRGIFSDWFKFPSCCVCRCYDLPMEFRVTSRSPRTHKQTLKIQQPGNNP